MKNGIENDTKIKSNFELHFLRILVDFGSILAPQIDQKFEKKCIKKQCDFKTKLECRLPRSTLAVGLGCPLGGPRNSRLVIPKNNIWPRIRGFIG